MNKKRNKLHDRELIEKLLKEKNSYSEIFHYLELPKSGGNCYKTLKDNLKTWNIDTTEFEKKSKLNRKNKISITKNKISKDLYPLDKILTYNTEYNLSGNYIKNRLYKEGIKKPICEQCGQDENWQGKKLSFHLDHINGDRVDNNIENLRILCPNCHSITDTYCGKNINKI